jgi:signal transduction histidine kinase
MQTRIRREVYLGSIHSRDYMLSNRADRLQTLQAQLKEAKAEAQEALVRLESVTGADSSLEALRDKVQEYWSTVEATPERTRRMKGDELYDYVQAEIVPRRNLVGALLRELEEVGRDALLESEAEFRHSGRAAILWLLGIMGVCVLLGLAVARLSLGHAARLERESAQRFAEVTQAKRHLEHLSARLLEIQEDERRRIARELHDEIGQTLTALRIEISRAQAALKAGSAAAGERLEEARALAERTLHTVRDISLLLRPALLDDLGLSAALQWQTEDFSRRSGIPCRYSEEGLEDALPDAHKTCVYRVVQEALNNCEKHSGASAVRLTVSQAAGELRVEVEDDGRGFELDAQGSPAGAAGLGILGMRERAAVLGGALEVESAPARGTRVRLSLPLPELAAEPALIQSPGTT